MSRRKREEHDCWLLINYESEIPVPREVAEAVRNGADVVAVFPEEEDEEVNPEQ